MERWSRALSIWGSGRNLPPPASLPLYQHTWTDRISCTILFNTCLLLRLGWWGLRQLGWEEPMSMGCWTKAVQPQSSSLAAKMYVFSFSLCPCCGVEADSAALPEVKYCRRRLSTGVSSGRLDDDLRAPHHPLPEQWWLTAARETLLFHSWLLVVVCVAHSSTGSVEVMVAAPMVMMVFVLSTTASQRASKSSLIMQGWCISTGQNSRSSLWSLAFTVKLLLPFMEAFPLGRSWAGCS